jgi:hypothetical protein
VGVLVPFSASRVSIVPELVKVPAVQAGEFGAGGLRVSAAAGGLLEQLGGAAVGQPGPAGDRAQVGGGHRADGFAAGEEHRPAAAAGEQPGQQQGGSGLPVHPFGHVAPQRLVPQRHIEPLADLEGQLARGGTSVGLSRGSGRKGQPGGGLPGAAGAGSFPVDRPPPPGARGERLSAYQSREPSHVH